MRIGTVEPEVCAAYERDVSGVCCVVHSGNLGDVLYSLPAVRALGTSAISSTFAPPPGFGSEA
jgi:hypothetical protein